MFGEMKLMNKYLKISYPTVDELLPQQTTHNVGAEVNNVLDLPERLLSCLQDKQEQDGR